MREVGFKTRVISGPGSLKCLSVYTEKRILIVCDRFLMENGAVVKLLKVIDNSCHVTLFDKALPDSPIDTVADGLGLFVRKSPDILIAFGGGSAIDTAKGILYCAIKQGLSNLPYFIAVPTTSGTGSEVTAVTVLSDPDEGIKSAYIDDCLIPDMAILDAKLTVSVPKQITANTGVDVLTHAVEAYVASGACAFTDALAEKATRLVMQSLLTSYHQGDDLEARSAMHEASTMAGMAFNAAGLGLSHGIAHQLGGMFHIPHGLANAIVLDKVIAFNAEDQMTRKKYSNLVRNTGMVAQDVNDEFAVEVLKGYVASLREVLNMPCSLHEMNVSRQLLERSMPELTSNAIADRCAVTNPIKAFSKDVENILISIF